MNLVSDPWIPVVWNDGRSGLVSLSEAFELGENIRDLTVRPQERIALMRLLICIAQHALNGPEDYVAWLTSDSRIASESVNYLMEWSSAFELFSRDGGFLQIANLRPKSSEGEVHPDIEGSPVSKLDLALATGNTATIFDNSGGTLRCFSPANVALLLTTFQCFSPGGRIGIASWAGEPTRGNGSSEHSPCMAGGMLHALVRGSNLVATIHLNLLHKGQIAEIYGEGTWGRPVWEWMPKSLGDSGAIENATKTYLGRLMPLSRALLLREDCETLVLANGLSFDSWTEGWREPTSTIVVRMIKEQPTRVMLAASLEKGTWRELHALTVKCRGMGPGGPVAMQNVASTEHSFDLWVGGLVANQAKPVDTMESVFNVPAGMLHEPVQLAYEAGVKYAEDWERRLRHAVEIYRLVLEANEASWGDYEKHYWKMKRPDRQRLASIGSKACANFWTLVENHLPFLFRFALDPVPVREGKVQYQETDWGRLVKESARDSYERYCSRGSPRRIRAFALGLMPLESTSKTQTAGEAIEEEAEMEVEA